MTTLAELYDFYCKRAGCRPNTHFALQLRSGDVVNFDFSANLVGPKGLSPVLEIARNNAELLSLNLSGNWLDKDAVRRVVEMAVRHPALRRVLLHRNPIHASSFKLLSYLLANNHNIVELGVDGTELSEHHIQRLAELVGRNAAAPSEGRVPRGCVTRVTARGSQPPDLGLAEGFSRWEGDTAGGCLNYTTWRHNPQLLLYLSRPCTVVISLEQLRDANTMHHIGLLVAKRRDPSTSRLLRLPAIDVVQESGFSNEGPAKVVVTLEACVRGRDPPYTVLPMCFYPDREGRFKVAVSGLRREVYGVEPPETEGPPQISLQEVEEHLDWFRHPELRGSWGAATAGGCCRYASWRSNPQFLLRTRAAGRVPTKVLISLSKGRDLEDNDERVIGFYLLRGDSGGRRKIFMADEDFAGEGPFQQASEVVLETELLGGMHDGYVIIPCCEDPGQVGDFSLRVWAASPVSVEELPRGTDWHETVLRGEWGPGTDGGPRHGPAQKAWTHNPSYTLRLAAPSDLLILLERESGQDSDPHNGRPVRHQLLVTDDTAAFGEVASSKPVAQGEGECALWLPMLQRYVTDYIVIPHTEQQSQHGQYCMRIYSSRPVEVGTERTVEDRAREKARQQHQEENAAALRRRDLAQPDEAFRPAAAASVGGTEAVQTREAITSRYLTTGLPHVDREFPPGASSLWRDADCPARALPLRAWERPNDCCARPTLFKGGPKSGNVVQGHLGDLWCLGAMALVATRPSLVQHLFVAAYPEYGFYQVRIFKFGEWQVVTVDDMIPVDASNQFVFAASPDSDELWPAILEKAYAKMHGSYEALEGAGDAAHALQDFTAGQVDRMDLISEAAKELLRSGVLWERLRAALRNRWLVGVQLLTSRGTRHDEKRGMGIQPEHLYGVLELRDVLGRRLVRLRDPWGLAPWRGRWSDGAKQWTQEILDSLDYTFSDDGTFWMAWEDFGYYFNDLLVCRMHSALCAGSDHWHQVQVRGEWTAQTSGGCALDGGDTWLDNPQYALEVTQVTAGEEVPVWLCVSQPDARLNSIANVTLTGGLKYRNSVGLHVADSESSDRRLVAFPVEPGDEMWVCAPHAGRENGRELQLRPGDRAHIAVPCCGEPRAEGPYLLTAAAPKPLRLRIIPGDLSVRVQGAWRGGTAGGAPGRFGTWRDNPMFVLSPSEATTVTVALAQHNDMNSTVAQIGFVVLSARHIRRPLAIDPDDVVATAEHANQGRVVAKVAVRSVKERCGQPYVIIPSTYYPNQESDFTIEVVGNKRMTLAPLDPQLDWVRTGVDGGWSHDEGTAGGGLGFPTWRLNPQYLLHFAERSAAFTLVLSKRLPWCVDRDTVQIGVVVFKCGGVEGGCRRKLTYEESDIVGLAESEGNANHVVLTLTLEGNSGDGYIVIPFTKYPYTDSSYSIAIYSGAELTLSPVARHLDWRSASAEGDWQPGLSAGGAREKHRGWVNNPNYLLRVGEACTLVLVLSQHPLQPGQAKGHKREAPPKGKGHLERYRPPLISDPKNNNDIGIDLCINDEDLTHLARSKYSFHSEVTLTVPRLKAGEYVVVPHTFEAERDCDFTVQAFTNCADFSFTKIEKQRRFY
eukprot:TRINITY_DN64837_c0_g1_i1.p1 TRINITY_DN64837_c0_g1~~TRINITY_DN64837_c0_g1_i1.p1  ORF type:complete len:1591 (+),score=580.01 TRINITY_DN64837_c0_g1_i1:76-4848(+)